MMYWKFATPKRLLSTTLVALLILLVDAFGHPGQGRAYALESSSPGAGGHDLHSPKPARDEIPGMTDWVELARTSLRPHLVRASELYEQGKYEEALSESSQAIAEEPTWAIAYFMRGYTYWKVHSTRR